MESEFVFVGDWYFTALWSSVSWHLPQPAPPSLFPPMIRWGASSARSPQRCRVVRLRVIVETSWKTAPLILQTLGLRPFQQFEDTQLSIGGTLAVPYTRDIAPDLSWFLSCHFLEPAYVSWVPGFYFHDDNLPFDHCVLPQLSGLGGVWLPSHRDGSVWFSAPVLWLATVPGGHSSVHGVQAGTAGCWNMSLSHMSLCFLSTMTYTSWDLSEW